MPPSKGRIVFVTLRGNGEPLPYNGEIEHPAIVTAVHGPDMINGRVFVDGNEGPIWVTSVPREGSQAGHLGHTWRWPPRADEAARGQHTGDAADQPAAGD